jgi:hypothetical protein
MVELEQGSLAARVRLRAQDPRPSLCKVIERDSNSRLGGFRPASRLGGTEQSPPCDSYSFSHSRYPVGRLLLGPTVGADLLDKIVGTPCVLSSSGGHQMPE